MLADIKNELKINSKKINNDHTFNHQVSAKILCPSAIKNVCFYIF